MWIMSAGLIDVCYWEALSSERSAAPHQSPLDCEPPPGGLLRRSTVRSPMATEWPCPKIRQNSISPVLASQLGDLRGGQFHFSRSPEILFDRGNSIISQAIEQLVARVGTNISLFLIEARIRSHRSHRNVFAYKRGVMSLLRQMGASKVEVTLNR